jgi:GTPase
MTGATESRNRIEHELGRDLLSISAVTGQGIPSLLHAIHERLKHRIEPAEDDKAMEVVPVPAGSE